ncbi:EamA family transporter, partial [Alicyclobacillaceae bacterium I2511]
MKRDWVGPLYLALAASIWGGMFVVSKIVLAVVPPLALVWLRYLVALLALAIVGLFTRQSWRIHWRDLPWFIVLGVVGYVVSISAQFYGTKLSTAQLGSVITAGTPAFMVLFAYPLLKERLTWRKGFSLVLATAGVVLVVGAGGVSLTPAYR